MMSMGGLPLGFRFHPEPEELFEILECKIGNLAPLSPIHDEVVTEGNVYDEQLLEDIFNQSRYKNKREFYFYFQLKKKTPNGPRFDRKVGKGKWKGQQKKKKSNKLLHQGVSRTYTYENEGSPQHKRWTMEEFILPKFGDYVICRLKKHDRGEEPGLVMQPDVSNQQLGAVLNNPSMVWNGDVQRNPMDLKSIEEHLLGDDLDISKEASSSPTTNPDMTELDDILNGIDDSLMDEFSMLINS